MNWKMLIFGCQHEFEEVERYRKLRCVKCGQEIMERVK